MQPCSGCRASGDNLQAQTNMCVESDQRPTLTCHTPSMGYEDQPMDQKLLPAISSESYREIHCHTPRFPCCSQNVNLLGPVQPCAAQPYPAQQIPVQLCSVYPSPVKSCSVQQNPVGPCPVPQSPLHPCPVQQSLVQPYQVQSSPSHPCPVQQSPVQPYSVQTSPSHPYSVHRSPVQPCQEQQNLVQPSPVQQSPVQSCPVQPSLGQPCPGQYPCERQTDHCGRIKPNHDPRCIMSAPPLTQDELISHKESPPLLPCGHASDQAQCHQTQGPHCRSPEKPPESCPEDPCAKPNTRVGKVYCTSPQYEELVPVPSGKPVYQVGPIRLNHLTFKEKQLVLSALRKVSSNLACLRLLKERDGCESGRVGKRDFQVVMNKVGLLGVLSSREVEAVFRGFPSAGDEGVLDLTTFSEACQEVANCQPESASLNKATR